MKKPLDKTPAFIIALLLISQGPWALLSARETGGEATVAEKAGDAAGADAGKPRVVGFEAGYNGGYSEGTVPRSYYSQPYVDIFLNHAYLKFTFGISRVWDYQITNGEGKYETVNCTQPKIAFSVYPYKGIEIMGEYRYWTGDKSHYYKTHDATGGLYLDFAPVSLGFTGNYRKIDYKFHSDDRKDKLSIFMYAVPPYTLFDRLLLHYKYKDFKKQNTKHLKEYTLSPVFTWHIVESTGLDVGYDYYRTYFENPYSFKNAYTFKNDSVIYYSHTGRLGVSSETCRFFSLRAGVFAGRGSDKYILAGGDIEGIVNLFDYASLSAAYGPTYNIAPSMDPMKRKFLEWRSYLSMFRALRGKRLNVNPYLRLKNIGRSFWSHAVTVNVSFRY